MSKVAPFTGHMMLKLRMRQLSKALRAWVGAAVVDSEVLLPKATDDKSRAYYI